MGFIIKGIANIISFFVYKLTFISDWVYTKYMSLTPSMIRVALLFVLLVACFKYVRTIRFDIKYNRYFIYVAGLYHNGYISKNAALLKLTEYKSGQEDYWNSKYRSNGKEYELGEDHIYACMAASPFSRLIDINRYGVFNDDAFFWYYGIMAGLSRFIMHLCGIYMILMYCFNINLI